MNNKKLKKISLVTATAMTIGLATAITYEANAQTEEEGDKNPIYIECVVNGEVVHTGIDCDPGSSPCTPDHDCSGSF